MDDPFSPTGVDAPSDIMVVASDEQSGLDVDADRWAALAARVLRSECVTGELTLTFVDADEITALNAEHMAIDGPTDVLSFPLDAADDDSMPVAGHVLLGDIVICPTVAAAAAPSHAGTVDDELALLTVHGVLHVLGYDHADEAAARAMRARELELLSDLHWCGPVPQAFVHEQAGS